MPQYIINPELRQPAYLQLYNQIREDITNGICPYHSKLPSKRYLAAETGTSVITVQHAYDLLADEGYIESRERSGYYVIYKENELFPVASAADDFGSAENPAAYGYTSGIATSGAASGSSHPALHPDPRRGSLHPAPRPDPPRPASSHPAPHPDPPRLA